MAHNKEGIKKKLKIKSKTVIKNILKGG